MSDPFYDPKYTPPRRTARGRQIVRLWTLLNYEDDGTTKADTVVDILTDLYHYCGTHRITWSNVVSLAEKWGLEESMQQAALLPTPEQSAQNMLDAILGFDPLSANDEGEDENFATFYDNDDEDDDTFIGGDEYTCDHCGSLCEDGSGFYLGHDRLCAECYRQV